MRTPGGRVLRVLGVAGDEERVYKVLLTRSSATLGELSAAVGAEPAQVVGSLELLEARGLVARSAGHPQRYLAAPPSAAIGALVAAQRAELTEVEAGLAGLAAEFDESAGDRGVGDRVEVVAGREAIAYRTDQLRHAAGGELIAFLSWPPDPDPHAVPYRAVITHEILERPGALDAARVALNGGTWLRVTERLPLTMTVADRALALVPLYGDAQPGALLIHPSSLLDGLVALFEAVWVAAVPLRLDNPADGETPATEGAIEDLDERILSLLLAGFTDRAVASQLGLSMRTVQRRVRHLMDLAGVQTRLQLGWHAARHDWV